MAANHRRKDEKWPLPRSHKEDLSRTTHGKEVRVTSKHEGQEILFSSHPTNDLSSRGTVYRSKLSYIFRLGILGERRLPPSLIALFIVGLLHSSSTAMNHQIKRCQFDCLPVKPARSSKIERYGSYTVHTWQ